LSAEPGDLAMTRRAEPDSPAARGAHGQKKDKIR